MSIDHTHRDWLDDSDCILPRYHTEFPRFADNYENKSKKERKPWGTKNAPVYVEPYIDDNLLALGNEQNYQKGVWYYTGYPFTDHHDFAGMPSIFGSL